MDAIIERHHELEAIVAALDRVSVASGGAMVLVEGEAGIGKSCLARYVREVSRERGLRVLGARGGELEGDVTFGVVRQLFERHLLGLPEAEADELLAGAAGLARAAVGLPARETASETGPAHGLYWLVANLARSEPLVLIVDDVQWADEESLRFLLYLARRLDGVGVLLFLAGRPSRGSRALDLLATELGGPPLRLAPLSAAGTAELLETRIGTIDPRIAAACHTASGGVPFFAREIAEELRLDPQTSVDQAVTQVEALLPASVVRSVLLRLGGEADAPQRLAAALAVIGDGATLRVAATVAGLGLDVAAGAYDRLVAIGIATAGATTGLAHPVIRAALHDDLGSARRRLLHQATAEALAELGTAPAAVAQHLLFADPRGDAPTAATLFEVGAQALENGAADTAVRLLQRALQEPPAPELLGRVLLALGRAERARGQAQPALGHLRAAATHDLAAEDRRETALLLAAALVETDGPLVAIEALEAAGGQLTGDDALRVEVERTLLELHSGVRDRLLGATTRLRRYADLPGETPMERYALGATQFAMSISPDGVAAEVLPLLRRAAAGAQLIAEQGVESQSVSTVTYALLFCEQFEATDAFLAAGFAQAQARGSVFGHFFMSFGAQVCALCRGETGSSVAHGERALGLLPELPAGARARLPGAFVTRFLIEALLARGDRDRARELVAAGLEVGDVDTMELNMIRYGRGLLAEHEGDPAAALADYLAYGALYEQMGFETRITPWRVAATRAAATAGDHATARRLADAALALAVRWGTPGGLGEAQHQAALVAERDAVLPGLLTAVETLRGTPMRLSLAGALFDLGSALRRAGERREARPVLEEAADLAFACGALPLGGRVRDELRVLGARPRKLAFSGVDSLTASERRIADLATEGLTNREIAQTLFLTAKTVEGHLSNVYRKLGIRSRSELSEELDQSA